MKQYRIHLLTTNTIDCNLRAIINNFSKSNEQPIIRIIDGKKCKTSHELFKVFAKEFNFPNYFGYNWDAFDECLNDLTWLKGGSYLLIILNIEQLLANELTYKKIFLQILSQTAQEWANGRSYGALITKPTSFEIILQCLRENEETVLQELANADIQYIDKTILI